MLPQHRLQSLGVEESIVWYLIDDVSEVREKVTLVLVCENGGYAGIVKLDVNIMNTDEVDRGIGRNEGNESIIDDLGDGALLQMSVSR